MGGGKKPAAPPPRPAARTAPPAAGGGGGSIDTSKPVEEQWHQAAKLGELPFLQGLLAKQPSLLEHKKKEMLERYTSEAGATDLLAQYQSSELRAGASETREMLAQEPRA